MGFTLVLLMIACNHLEKGMTEDEYLSKIDQAKKYNSSHGQFVDGYYLVHHEAKDCKMMNFKDQQFCVGLEPMVLLENFFEYKESNLA